MKASNSDAEKTMPKIIDKNLVMPSVLSAVFGSLSGSLFLLIYLYWAKNNDSAEELVSVIFVYLFTVMISIYGTLAGTFIVGLPVVVITRRIFPAPSFKGCFFILFTTLFIWLVVLAWPVISIFDITYHEILLLSPYVFCSVAALTYLIYWKGSERHKSGSA